MDIFTQLGIECLSQDIIDDLAARASAYALLRGLVLEDKHSPGEIARCPFMLLPTPFPKKLFQEGWDLARHLQILFHKISNDHEFLKNTLEGSVQSDPSFLGRIYNIYDKTRLEGISQPLALTIFRHDYMLDVIGDGQNSEDQLKISCVEYNGMPGSIVFGESTTDLASFVLGLLDKDVPNGSPQLPYNRVFEESCEAMATAWEYYGSKSEGHEVAIAYYRMGNQPKSYSSEEYWDLRLLIERSHAIKVPSLATRLTMSKHVQQKLTEPGVLERYLSDQDQIKRIRKTFKRIYNFKGPDADQITQMAIRNPDNFVLKPDKDGGGNNFNGDDIRTKLEEVSSVERSQFILMEKINYPSIKNFKVDPCNPNTAVRDDVHCELGIFGIVLSCGNNVLINKPAGYLMRTKPMGVLDGGISNGSAFHDNPYLV